MDKDNSDFESFLQNGDKINKLEKKVNALERDFSTLKQELSTLEQEKQIEKIVEKILLKHNLINQNSVELEQNYEQGGQSYGANIQSGVFAGFRGGINPATQLRPDDFNSQQNSSSNGRSDEQYTSNLTDLPTSNSQNEEYGKSTSGDREGNMPESRSETNLEIYKAVGEGLKESARIYRKQIKLNEYELKKCNDFFKIYSQWYNYANPDIKRHLEQLFNKNLKISINTFFEKEFQNTLNDRKQFALSSFALKIKGYIYAFEKMNLTMHKQNKKAVDELTRNKNFLANTKEVCVR